jgi:signal transduction histidine kinase
MSKETAHQLGTPISSMVGWVEYLKGTGTDPRIIKELEKDVNRLELITERFSKIGSPPELVKTDLDMHLRDSFNYLKSRTSKQVDFNFHNRTGEPLYAKINAPLFDWVIENLVKNALDAMEGLGKIDMTIDRINGQISIDVSDTGKGISKSKYKQVFQPGYSTKKRGWGLGLSLTKRIVENYHNGRIFVKHSVVDEGTTFRIVLPGV